MTPLARDDDNCNFKCKSDVTRKLNNAPVG